MEAPKPRVSCWLIFILINIQFEQCWTTAIKLYGAKCNEDYECQTLDHDLICYKSDVKVCKCKRNYVWDMERKKCFLTLFEEEYKGKFDPVKHLIIPTFIIMTIGAMLYVGIRILCNWKMLRRRTNQEIERELQELTTGSPETVWTAFKTSGPQRTSTRPPSASYTKPFSRAQTSNIRESYERMPGEWSFTPFPGTCTSSPGSRSVQSGPPPRESRRVTTQHSGLPFVTVSMGNETDPDVISSQPRSTILRPGQAQIIHGNGPSVHIQIRKAINK